ncbi:hypothetical protein E2C01_060885 [Portunus trituberculatus]|uniref:Uncharacterized protein n=1 Tax=Portunus trituberculatus TaxID=210409 RepID=A0A5B7H9B3_PORTR|nr:hypothetical protein [Portunus trituberculatus]
MSAHLSMCLAYHFVYLLDCSSVTQWSACGLLNQCDFTTKHPPF